MKIIHKSKGLLAVLTVLMTMMTFLAGCGTSQQAQLIEDKVNVVTTFYPLYFLTQQIGGDAVNVINLIPTGVEPHDWTPKSKDLQNASNAQLLIYQGAGFEGWFEDFKKGLEADSQVQIVEASKGVKLISTAEEDHDHEASGDGHDHGNIDPHTWVSPKSALVMAENVKNALIQVDPSHQADFEKRYEALHAQLVDLDQKYERELSNVKHRDIVVSHQAFGYLARDYNLTQHALMGISADSEPRAQDIVELTKLVKEKDLKYVFFEELVSDEMANMIASEAGVETLVLNPLEGLTTEQEQNGDNYITLMERNLNNLLLALQ
ncbi:metal ABC transporter substrate-binding protein [Paenibacillus marinisediminis]